MEELSFNVSWIGYHAPNVTIEFYDLQYRFNGGAWQTWDTFTTTSGLFDLVNPGVDGAYDFEARARDSNNQTEPWTGIPEASMIVDRHPPFIDKPVYLPLIMMSE